MRHTIESLVRKVLWWNFCLRNPKYLNEPGSTRAIRSLVRENARFIVSKIPFIH